MDRIECDENGDGMRIAIGWALELETYRIYPDIRQGFCPYRMTSNKYISPMKFCYKTKFTLPKQS